MKHNFRDFGDAEPLYDVFKREANRLCNRVDFGMNAATVGTVMAVGWLPLDVSPAVVFGACGAAITTLLPLFYKTKYPNVHEAAVLRGFQRYQALNPGQNHFQKHVRRTALDLVAPVLMAQHTVRRLWSLCPRLDS